MVNLLTLAASLKAGGHSQSNKTRVTKLGSRNKLSLIAITTPIYCFSSLSSKHFLEIFDAVCNLGRKQTLQCLRVVNEFINCLRE